MIMIIKKTYIAIVNIVFGLWKDIHYLLYKEISCQLIVLRH